MRRRNNNTCVRLERLLRIFPNWNRREFVLDVYCSFNICTATLVRGRSCSVVTSATECRTGDPCDEFYFIRIIKSVSGVSFKILCNLRIRVACVWVHKWLCKCVASSWGHKKKGCEKEDVTYIGKDIGYRRSNFKVSHLSVICKILWNADRNFERFVNFGNAMGMYMPRTIYENLE